MSKSSKTTLCWLCANAVPSEKYGCAWSTRYEPVPGWDADVSTTNWAEQWDETIYCVKKCPQFIPQRNAEQVDKSPEGLERLSMAVVKCACDDYRNNYRKIVAYESSKLIRKLYSIRYHNLYGTFMQEEAYQRKSAENKALRKFFHSEYAKSLLALDYDWLIPELEKDVEDEFHYKFTNVTKGKEKANAHKARKKYLSTF